ncbi:methyltransferase domain-containing protein [Pelagibacterales bacterium SAG-MED12]|nr:methyltransferase domain-containing protein [Pelagibacterales bacterium SAG-MED12]
MVIKNTVKKRSISSNKLKKRLDINKKLGSVDLTSWLFKRYKINKGDFILEIGCGVGQHIKIEKKIVGKKGFILATDISGKSLKNIKKSKNVLTKKIAMEDLPKYLKNLDIKFDKIISSYAFYYANNPINLIGKLKKVFKNKR